MSVDLFLDSNVLLYTFDNESPRKQQIARSIVEECLRSGSGCISYQVAQEVFSVLTRKFDPSLPYADAIQFLANTLEPLWQVQPSAELIRSGLSLRVRYGYSFYDSLIIAAALAAGCSTLLSEDLRTGQRIESLMIKDPFIPSP